MIYVLIGLLILLFISLCLLQNRLYKTNQMIDVFRERIVILTDFITQIDFIKQLHENEIKENKVE